MRRAFLTGLAILLPLVLTYIILMFLLNLLTGPFITLLHTTPLLKPLILLILFAAVVMTGYFAQKTLFHLPLLHRIPFYTLISDTLTTLLNARKSKFTKAYLVPFPSKDSYAIGFSNGNDTLFVPATPNLTIGYLIRSNDAIELDMSVADAFKLLLAFGYIENDKTQVAHREDA